MGGGVSLMRCHFIFISPKIGQGRSPAGLGYVGGNKFAHSEIMRAPVALRPAAINILAGNLNGRNKVICSVAKIVVSFCVMLRPPALKSILRFVMR